MRIIIDVETYAKARLIAALRRLKSTVSVSDGGAYRGAPENSQIHLETSLTVKQVDAWACRVKAGVGYLGAVEAKNGQG